MKPEARPQRPEVISLRLNAARVELLERYRRAFVVELGRDVSLSEAAFLALDDRAAEIDRAATRAELLTTPTESLCKIRRQWETEHGLSAAQWDVLADYIRVGAEEDRHDPPAEPAIPSRDSYVALLDAFSVAYERRATPVSRHTWTYLGNLGGLSTVPTGFADQPPDQQERLLLKQVAEGRQRLLADPWERPGNVGHCLWVALREEGIDSATLDRVMAPHWEVLWRLAARGHWIRHAHRPVRMAGSGEGRRLGPMILPGPLSADEFTLSFTSAAAGDLSVTIASRSRGFGLDINRYPELVEFRVLVESTEDRWVGRYYSMAVEAQAPARRRVQLTRRRMYLEFSKPEWIVVRDLVRRAWQIPGIQYRLAALQRQYGEHG
jgi:hypothetical protein